MPETRPGRISDEALEIGKLIVELLDTGYRRRSGGASTGSPGISPNGIRAGMQRYQHAPLTVGELARGLGISYGWASRVADELAASGYLERERSADDRRVVRVRLSDASLVQVEHAYRRRGDAVDAALRPFDTDERDVIQRFLRRLVDELRAASTTA
jgi:DNA-binding MarR family transcriptional regulator